MPKGIYIRSASTMLAISNLGKSSKGVKRSSEFCEKRRLAMQGSSNPMFGKKRTPEEIDLMSSRRRGLTAGDKNPNWRGGKSKIAHIIRTHPEYGRWREAILVRDNFTCQICGKRGGDLNVDHYPITFKDILQKFSIRSIQDAINCKALWDTDNNRTLCVSCHKGGLPYEFISRDILL